MMALNIVKFLLQYLYNCQKWNIFVPEMQVKVFL